MTTMSITDMQAPVMEALCRDDWKVTNFYPDGVVRLAKEHSGELVGVFVRLDGSVTQPITVATAMARCELRDMGITCT